MNEAPSTSGCGCLATTAPRHNPDRESAPCAATALTTHGPVRTKKRELKLPLPNQSSFQRPVFPPKPLADPGGFFIPGRIVVERDRDRRERMKALLLLLRQFRPHERRRLQSLLMEPERPP